MVVMFKHCSFVRFLFFWKAVGPIHEKGNHMLMTWHYMCLNSFVSVCVQMCADVCSESVGVSAVMIWQPLALRHSLQP